MEHNDLISVIIPVYNVEKYVEKSINSILKQTYTNFEIILVDDGSTDNSGKICDSYARKYKCIKVIHQKNFGLSAARNVGVNQSKGDYICFLDSDDWYSDNVLEEFIFLKNKYNSDISLINVFNVFDENTQYESKDEICYYTKSEAMQMLFNNAVVFGTSCNRLYKREIFKNIKFPEGLAWEDMYISLDVLLESNSVAFSKKACLYYRKRKNSITNSHFSRRNLDELKAIDHVGAALEKAGYSDLWAKNQSRCLNYLMKTYIKISGSNFPDKEGLMKDYKRKVIKTFLSMPSSKWRFKDIKRFFLFKMSPKLYRLFSFRN